LNPTASRYSPPNPMSEMATDLCVFSNTLTTKENVVAHRGLLATSVGAVFASAAEIDPHDPDDGGNVNVDHPDIWAEDEDLDDDFDDDSDLDDDEWETDSDLEDYEDEDDDLEDSDLDAEDTE
jgi:hypothetical protein